LFIVDGSYANWSLNSSCSVTCGKGFEKWTRECNKPEQKYGGKTVVIWDILLNIGYVLQSLALVSDMVLHKVNTFPLAFTFLSHYSLLKP
jgi:hypothetical protein